MKALLDKIRRGDRRSLGRAMSLVDQTGDQARALQDHLRQSTGQVPWWGFTGPPGVGKSTLIDALLTRLRERQQRVGVVAIDPTSPTSDGALLGDRVRMMRHAIDPDVFIRSLATHHREGGLSDAAIHCARLLEVGNFDPVLIETVGVGQNEVDIASVADICVAMLGPGYGDDIQLIKAGLLQVADIVVVNKCDLPEATRLLKEVREELEFDSSTDGGDEVRPPERRCVGIEAKTGRGVEELVDQLLALDAAARTAERRHHYARRRFRGEVSRSVLQAFEQALERELNEARTDDLLARLDRSEISFDAVVAELNAQALAKAPGEAPGK